MKKTLLLLITVLLLGQARSQNGGQNGENESLKVTAGGVTSDWKQIIIVTNKQNCPVDIRFEHNDRTAVKNLSALSSDTFHVTLPNCSLRVKPLDNCGGANMGWVEFNVCVALPVKFEYFRVRKISGTLHEVEFKIQSSSKQKYFNIQVSKDGINYKNVTIISADEIQPGQIYKTKINL